MTFADGTFGTIENSRCAVYGYDQRVEVFGSGGALSLANQAPHAVTLSDQHGIHGPMPYNFFMDRYPESYVNELQEFVDCVLDDTEPTTTGVDGRAAVAVALAAKRSLAERRPVKVDEVS